MKAVATFAALLALLAIACQGGEEAPPEPASTAAETPSPTSAAPSPTPEAEGESWLIFVHPQLGPLSEPPAVLHMSDLASSNVIQLTPADVRASFVGLAERDGTSIAYYVAGDEISNAFTLEARDLGTGEALTLTSFGSQEVARLSGSLSPDGRHIAISHRDGIDLFDLGTDAQRRILDSNPAACEAGQVGDCYGYYAPSWSPDGRLLLLEKVFYETGTAVVVDPFQEAPQELGESFIGDPFPSFAAWSPASSAFCAYGQYDAPSGLYVSEEPEWQFRNLLPEYEAYEPDAPRDRSVEGCVWLDEKRIAFATAIREFEDSGFEHRSAISIYDVAAGEVTALTEFGAYSPELFLVPGTSTLVLNDRNNGQPDLLDTIDGTRTPILQPGDRVVAVTQPIALPEKIVAATPEVGPCVPLTAQCEAEVTNVGPEQLNVREGPNLTTDVIGQLSEGEVVCLTAWSLFAEGFRWWPVRWQGGLEGWVAHGDPQEPGRPWLIPTGRKCEQ